MNISQMYDSGLSYSQIAEHIGTTKNAVAGMLFRERNPIVSEKKPTVYNDLWTEGRLTEKWENRKKRRMKKC